MSIPSAIPSASVIVLHNGIAAPEILLVKRNTKISFHGGAWVFPGGKVDPADHEQVTRGDELEAARHAAAREAGEEAGLLLDGASLRPFSHWTTPETQPKRFSTWFFIAEVSVHAQVEIDCGEIVDYCWLTVDDALEQHARDEIALPPPTFVSLIKLRPFNHAGAIVDYFQGGGVERFVPRIVEFAQGRCALYEEDAGYESLDLAAVGARHRLMMLKSGWEYLREV